MWMRYVGDIGNAGPDKGKGGRFIIPPPGFEGQVPDGYHVFRSKTYGVWCFLRGFLVDGETGPAVASFKEHLKIYPFSRAGNPPAMEFKNVSGKVHNTIHANDLAFFYELDSLIQEDHDDAISPEARGRLAMLGIIKGRPFEPDDHTRKTLDEAARVGAVIARSLSFESRDKTIYFYPDDHTWFSPFSIGNHEFLTKGSWLNLDARVQFMYNAIGITPAMAIEMPGIGSQYAAACRDSDGAYLDGSKTYKLRLPPNVPAKDFWSIILYDSQTRPCCRPTSVSRASTVNAAVLHPMRMDPSTSISDLKRMPARRKTGFKRYPVKLTFCFCAFTVRSIHGSTRPGGRGKSKGSTGIRNVL